MQWQNDLDKLCSVVRSWNLKLNICKCVVLSFRTRHATDSVAFNWSNEGKILEFVSMHRDLAVLVDLRLQFHDYVHSIVRKALSLAGEFFVLLFVVVHILWCLCLCLISDLLWLLFPRLECGLLGEFGLLESVQRRWTRQVACVGHLGYDEGLKELGVSLFTVGC